MGSARELGQLTVIVLTNGGKLSSKKILYNRKTIDIVIHYKRLGDAFNSRLMWGQAKLVGKANKALSMI